MRIGNTEFNLEEVEKLSFEQFKKIYAGKIDTDISQTYRKLTAKANSPSNRKTK